VSPFCLDCRSALRGVRSCDPRHRVVDLARADGRDAMIHEVFERDVSTIEELPRPWLPPGLVLFAVAGVSIVIGVALLIAGQVLVALVIGACGLGAIAFGLEPRLAGQTPRTAARPRALGARAEPPWSVAPEKFVGTIESAVGTRSPFAREECAGWALEVSLAGAGVMLRDGVTSGMTIALEGGRTLIVPSEMLRLARGASSDDVDSDALSAHVAAVDELIAWDEARALVLRVGDRVEIVCSIRESDDAAPSGYREVTATRLTAVDVPVVRRVTAR